MQKCYRNELIGLFGCPVDENATVVVMDAAFLALGLNYRYINYLVHPQGLPDAVRALKALNMRGTHITIPHKVEVLKYLDHISETAARMGAVNTIYLKDGETYGENTDGKGFLLSLQQADIPLAGKKAVVLGAGGAARAMTIELAGAGVSRITIVNRSRERGEALAAMLTAQTQAGILYATWDTPYRIPPDTDLVINATSVGMLPDPNKPDIDYTTLLPRMVVCDGVHNPVITPFLKAAIGLGCRTLDGFSMLINQSAVSFKLWTGLDAPIDVMREALKRELNQ